MFEALYPNRLLVVDAYPNNPPVVEAPNELKEAPPKALEEDTAPNEDAWPNPYDWPSYFSALNNSNLKVITFSK